MKRAVKSTEVPCHHNLENLDAYIAAARLADESDQLAPTRENITPMSER
jgi:hypothetical protein